MTARAPIRCPSCGAVNEPEARFCGECGNRIPAPPTSPEGSGVVPTVVPVHGKGAPALGAATVASKASEALMPTSYSPLGFEPLVPGKGAPPPIATVAPPEMGHSPKRIPSTSDLPAPVPGPPSPEEIDAAARKPKIKTLDRIVGRTLNGRYKVNKKLGEGGFGAVFEGTQVATGRPVALKILHPHNVQDTTVVARFRREAEACSKLRNPHTVTIYDFDETDDGILYLAMELLAGSNLQQVTRDSGPLDPLRVVRIIDQVAEALGEAHALGIVHRDMKPENIMIEDRDGADFVKVLDFGIAKIVTEEGSRARPALTAVGQTLGTLEFMSPEQLRGKDLDGRSDIYALGMVAYEMLTGELPFKDAKSSTDVIQFHLQAPPPKPSSLRTDLDIPGPVDDLVTKMVAKSRDDRFADTNELRAQIQSILTASDRGPDRKEALRVVAVVGGLLLLIAAAILFTR